MRYLHVTFLAIFPVLHVSPGWRWCGGADVAIPPRPSEVFRRLMGAASSELAVVEGRQGAGPAGAPKPASWESPRAPAMAQRHRGKSMAAKWWGPGGSTSRGLFGPMLPAPAGARGGDWRRSVHAGHKATCRHKINCRRAAIWSSSFAIAQRRFGKTRWVLRRLCESRREATSRSGRFDPLTPAYDPRSKIY
jgi:hypothetical protein